MNCLFVITKNWLRIREHFSEEEKDKLNAAIIGEAICPQGVWLDEAKAGETLVIKIKAVIKGLK
jgi:hypothetical protein